MAQMKTYRCWFKDDTAMMVCDENAPKAKAKAAKRNAARVAGKFDPNQGNLFGGGAA